MTLPAAASSLLPDTGRLEELSLTVLARVTVDGDDWPDTVEPPVRVVVDTHQHLPDMFEITLLDDTDGGTALDDAGLVIGAAVEISDGAEDVVLIVGEVTALEARCDESVMYTIARGYEKTHRLQRAKHSHVFSNDSDSGIARSLAEAAGLEIGTIEHTGVTHDHLAQTDQTDWEFLQQRAREIGHEVLIADGKFHFRKAAGPAAGVGSALAAIATGTKEVTATFKEDLLSFAPRVSAANLPSKVEVRVWDPDTTKTVVGEAKLSTRTADLDQGPGELAEQFTTTPNPLTRPKSGQPGLAAKRQALLAADSAGENTFAVVDQPVARGADTQRSVDRMAAGLAEQIASTFAEATGTVAGNPDVQAGTRMTVKGVPAQFAGVWTITNARHVFDLEEGGYHTHFVVSGRQDRSTLGLVAGASGGSGVGRIPGVVCGIVTDVDDPEGRGRVKVSLPWLAAAFVTDWARTTQFGLGGRGGGVFLPEVNDEVLVAFEFGDPRRPYVLGGLHNTSTRFAEERAFLGDAGSVRSVVERGIYTSTGSQLVFQDGLPPSAAGATPLKSAEKSRVVLGGLGEKLALVIDNVAGSVDLTCAPDPGTHKTGQGTLTISCGAGGELVLRTGDGPIRIDAGTGDVAVTGGQLKFDATGGVSITSGGTVKIDGRQIELN
ncbi:phage baseplate assembly protein V [Amycolatopsis sp. NBC_01307]|uniref:phage baseplate assembly protein V n=1 Tax=Amycolatopsis sp. NBC_01307 TaxID=2903561 RepID=UPI002E111B3A|nr:phage baseplate assembly protein V [Amycolatopsis sp. NBC_01307]